MEDNKAKCMQEIWDWVDTNFLDEDQVPPNADGLLGLQKLDTSGSRLNKMPT